MTDARERRIATLTAAAKVKSQSASADRSDAPGHVSITPSQNPSMPH
jgi:hypothetical protein